MSKTPLPISVSFPREWRIRRPRIYRYLDKKHVDSFFETGAIRISSYAKFATHPDEERLDTKEGKAMVVHTNHEGTGQTFSAIIGQGANAYILCGSMVYDTSLSKVFQTNSGFRIDDSLGFSEAISKYIPGFYIGLEGPCTYLPARIIERDMGRIDLESLKVAPGKEFDASKLMKLAFDVAGDDLFFLKHLRYAHQSEYRLLWHTPKDVSGHIDIICPEARQFCTRFEDQIAEMGSVQHAD